MNTYLKSKTFLILSIIIGLGGYSCTTLETSNNVSSPPKGPIDVVEYDVTTTTAKISWEQPLQLGNLRNGGDAKVLYYKLQYDTLSDFDNPKTLFVFGTDTIIRNLKINTEYFVRVKTKNNNKENPNRSESTYTLLKNIKFKSRDVSNQEKPSEPPVNVTASNITSNQASITWAEPFNKGTLGDEKPASIIGYELEYSISSTFTPSIKISVKGISTTLNRLSPETTYYVRVKAINNNSVELKNKSGFAILENRSFTTLSEITSASKAEAPEPPTDVSSSDISPVSAKISWKAPDKRGKLNDGSVANITGYELDYSTEIDYSNKITVISKYTEYILRNLTASTRYYVRVRTINNNGISQRNISLYTAISSGNFDTLASSTPSSQPTNITASDITVNSATIVWLAPEKSGDNADGTEAVISSYSIEYSLNDDYTDAVIKTSIRPSISVGSLESGATYYVRIRSINSGGATSEYGTGSFTTVTE